MAYSPGGLGSTEETLRFSYLVELAASQAKEYYGKILNRRGYNFDIYNPAARNDHDVLSVDRELDPETIREIKDAGFKLYKQI